MGKRKLEVYKLSEEGVEIYGDVMGLYVKGGLRDFRILFDLSTTELVNAGVV